MKLRSVFIAFCITTPLLFIIRMIEQLFLIEPTTGFFLKEWAFLENIIVLVQIALLISLIVMSRFSSKAPRHSMISSKGVGITSFFLSAGMIVYMFEYGLSCYPLKVGDYIYLIVSLAFALFILYYGFCMVAKMRVTPLSAIVPVLFAAFRLALMFTKRNGIAKISDTVNETIMLGLTMMFWLLFGKITAELEVKKASRYAYGIGSAAAAMCFAVALPKYIIELFMTEQRIHISTTPSYIDILTGVFITVYLIAFLKNDLKTREKYKDSEKIISSVSQIDEVKEDAIGENDELV